MVLAFFFFFVVDLFCFLFSYVLYLSNTQTVQCRPLGLMEGAENRVETLVSCSIISPVDVRVSVSLEWSGNPRVALRGL